MEESEQGHDFYILLREQVILDYIFHISQSIGTVSLGHLATFMSESSGFHLGPRDVRITDSV